MTTTFLQIKDNAQSTISGALASGGASVDVATGEGSKFPASGTFRCTIWDNDTYPNNPTADPGMEIVEVTSRSSDTLTIGTRGVDDTSDVTHADGSAIAILVMEEHLAEMRTAINNNETDIAALKQSKLAGVAAGIATATSNLSLTASWQDIPGATITITPTAASKIMVWVTADIDGNTAQNCAVALNVDGSRQSAQAAVRVTTDRFTVSQVFLVSLDASEHTIKLQGQNADGSAGTVYSTHTNFLYFLFAQ
jgi:hypothetical protein